ncbi:hypothetical protein A6X21_15040 [Planctopirus hydrillae]|uniref:Uncharacterized protein n=1 Tax=Planctopirus hydrillae TaxID=1841610 RepID=A0A1C3E3P3_9PLAN|nr:hypothetical protein A6X21_15040 [Planctopirus hydrillae]
MTCTPAWEWVTRPAATLSHEDAGEGSYLLLPFRREKAGMRANSNLVGVLSTSDPIAKCFSSLDTDSQSAPLHKPL